jgi:hypothetical protein
LSRAFAEPVHGNNGGVYTRYTIAHGAVFVQKRYSQVLAFRKQLREIQQPITQTQIRSFLERALALPFPRKRWFNHGSGVIRERAAGLKQFVILIIQLHHACTTYGTMLPPGFVHNIEVFLELDKVDPYIKTGSIDSALATIIVEDQQEDF